MALEAQAQLAMEFKALFLAAATALPRSDSIQQLRSTLYQRQVREVRLEARRATVPFEVN